MAIIVMVRNNINYKGGLTKHHAGLITLPLLCMRMWGMQFDVLNSKEWLVLFSARGSDCVQMNLYNTRVRTTTTVCHAR